MNNQPEPEPVAELISLQVADLQLGQLVQVGALRGKVQRLHRAQLKSNLLRVRSIPPRSGAEAWGSLRAASAPQQDAEGAWLMPADWSELADCKLVFEAEVYSLAERGATLVQFALSEHQLAQWQRSERERLAALRAERTQAEQARLEQWLADWKILDI